MLQRVELGALRVGYTDIRLTLTHVLHKMW